MPTSQDTARVRTHCQEQHITIRMIVSDLGPYPHKPVTSPDRSFRNTQQLLSGSSMRLPLYWPNTTPLRSLVIHLPYSLTWPNTTLAICAEANLLGRHKHIGRFHVPNERTIGVVYQHQAEHKVLRV
jgi:hypothetical protein